MIQDIAPHHLNNAWLPQPPSPDSYALFYEGNTALVRHTEDGFTFPRFRELEADNDDIYQHYTYLFTVDEEHFYLLDHITVPAPSPYVMENTQFFRGAAPRWLAFARVTGHHLFLWYGSRRFCGRCGAPLHPDTRERMLRCDRCGQMEYPKICPAVIVAVTDGNRLLLSKYAGRTNARYALVAGFTEIGETLEETVQREVMEEVGLKVKNIRYYKSRPWGFSSTILAGFFCDLDGSDQITLDQNELAEAEWFAREDVPLQDETHASMTQEMIRWFKTGHT